MAKTAVPTIFCGFGSLMDIDKLIRTTTPNKTMRGFGSLMDIDKLIRAMRFVPLGTCFGSLMDIDKLIQRAGLPRPQSVLVL